MKQWDGLYKVGAAVVAVGIVLSIVLPIAPSQNPAGYLMLGGLLLVAIGALGKVLTSRRR